MIIWSGWGILVVPLVAITVAVFTIIAGAAGMHNMMGMVAGFVAAAPLTWLLGQKLNRPNASRTLVDPETGETVLLQRRHSLFFIPVQYWAVPCIILSGLLLFILMSAPK